MIRRFLTVAAAAFAVAFAVAEARAQTPEAFPYGLDNVPQTHWMRGRDQLEMPYPARWHQWFDDFNQYTAGDWVITTTEAGPGDASETITDADNGVLLITNDSNEDDADFFQSVGEIFTFESGEETYFEARFQINDVTQTDFVLGIGVRDTTPLATANFVGFQSEDGDALLDFHSISGSTDTASTGVATLVDATWVIVAFYYDGGSRFIIAVDDTVVATMTATPPTTEMTLSFGLQNGEAAADTMSIDYILVQTERQ